MKARETVPATKTERVKKMKNQTITQDMINTRSARDLEAINEIMEDGNRTPAQAMERIAMIAEKWAKMAEEQNNETEIFDGTYAIKVTGEDKAPSAPDNRARLDYETWILLVEIREGYTTLDKETVTRILTISHGARIGNLTPLAAYEVAEDGRADLDNPVKTF